MLFLVENIFHFKQQTLLNSNGCTVYLKSIYFILIIKVPDEEQALDSIWNHNNCVKKIMEKLWKKCTPEPILDTLKLKKGICFSCYPFALPTNF